MTEKLNLKQIAPYLPYGLQMIFKGKGGRLITLTGINDQGNHGITITSGEGSMWLNESSFKPILHPLSNIDKEIKHNGKIFIPLLELAKIEDSRNAYLADDENGNPIIGRDDSDFNMGSMTYAHTYRFRFDTESMLFVIDLLDEDGSMICEIQEVVLSNITLLDKLYEWHFDVFGLIDKGLAIDINNTERGYNG